MARSLEQTASCVEHAAVELRSLCEASLPAVSGIGGKLEPLALDVAGQIETNEFGWLHIRLNTLLPHCRFASPLWLTDTISRLLSRRGPEAACHIYVLPMENAGDFFFMWAYQHPGE